MSVCCDPGRELTPRRSQALVWTAVDGSRNLDDGHVAGPYTSRSCYLGGDRHTDLEIKNRRVHLQMMSEPRPGRAKPLRLNRRHEFPEARTHDRLHFISRNGDVDEGQQLNRRLGDLGCIDHACFPQLRRCLRDTICARVPAIISRLPLASPLIALRAGRSLPPYPVPCLTCGLCRELPSIRRVR